MKGNAKPGIEVNFKPLDTEFDYKDAVVSFPSQRSMFKVSEIMPAMNQAFYSSGHTAFVQQFQQRGGLSGNSQQWSDQGVICEVLRPSSGGWRKGKMRIRFVLEFCPDEPDIEETSVSNQLGVSTSDAALEDIRRSLSLNG